MIQGHLSYSSKQLRSVSNPWQVRALRLSPHQFIVEGCAHLKMCENIIHIPVHEQSYSNLQIHGISLLCLSFTCRFHTRKHSLKAFVRVMAESQDMHFLLLDILKNIICIDFSHPISSSNPRQHQTLARSSTIHEVRC